MVANMTDQTVARATSNGVAIIGDAATLNDAYAAFTAAGIEVLDAGDLLGDEFGDVVKKEQLVGVPFLVVDVKFHNDGEFGPFAAILCLGNDGKRFVFTDGSTGVYRQLVELAERFDDRPLAGIACRKGLRASEYEKDGRKAVTYYLA